MTALSEGVKAILVADGVGTGTLSADWGIHISKMPASPPSPARVIAIFDTGGAAPWPHVLLDFPTVQVRVRGGVSDYSAAYDKAKNVKDSLLNLPSATIGGDKWERITQLADIAFVGRDEGDLPEFNLNFRVIVKPSTNALTNRAVLPSP